MCTCDNGLDCCYSFQTMGIALDWCVYEVKGEYIAHHKYLAYPITQEWERRGNPGNMMIFLGVAEEATKATDAIKSVVGTAQY